MATPVFGASRNSMSQTDKPLSPDEILEKYRPKFTAKSLAIAPPDGAGQQARDWLMERGGAIECALVDEAIGSGKLIKSAIRAAIRDADLVCIRGNLGRGNRVYYVSRASAAGLGQVVPPPSAGDEEPGQDE